MNSSELISKPVKQNGEKSNWDFHIRLSCKEKERLVMLTKANNCPTIASFVRGQIFRPDIHHKLDLILKRLPEAKIKKEE